MKLSSSTGDFSHFAETVPQKISCFRDTKFQYLNLEHNGKRVTRLLDPSLGLKQKAVDLLYDVGEYLLGEYGLLEI